jgi:hypothetical protein
MAKNKELDKIWAGGSEEANLAGLVITTVREHGLISDFSVTDENGCKRVSFLYKKVEN